MPDLSVWLIEGEEANIYLTADMNLATLLPEMDM